MAIDDSNATYSKDWVKLGLLLQQFTSQGIKSIRQEFSIVYEVIL